MIVVTINWQCKLKNKIYGMRTILFILISAIAITSTISGVLMIMAPNGGMVGLSTLLLKDTPFRDFLVPGILLTGIVGGMNLIAIYTLISHNNNYCNWAMIAGITTSAWIISQILSIQDLHWLQFVYLAAGILITLIAYQLKGKWAV